MQSMTPARGFSLLELMVAVTILGVLAATAVVNLQAGLPAQRSAAAARQLMMDLRSASAIAARTNQIVAVELNIAEPTCPPDDAGRRHGWRVYSRQALNPGVVDRLYVRECLASSFGGVRFGLAASAPATDLRCAEEAPIASTPNDSCTACAANTTINFFPSGEVDLADGASVALLPSRDLGAATELRALFAVGVAPVTGRARIYRPAVDGLTWECR